mmetsp:Transcript_53704/g.151286  ORF Transcript_53704/g.151286 Transcript_53704/m.151286 type:complete len:474 (-) Transcript_53704:323-1744(-)
MRGQCSRSWGETPAAPPASFSRCSRCSCAVRASASLSACRLLMRLSKSALVSCISLTFSSTSAVLVFSAVSYIFSFWNRLSSLCFFSSSRRCCISCSLAACASFTLFSSSSLSRWSSRRCCRARSTSPRASAFSAASASRSCLLASASSIRSLRIASFAALSSARVFSTSSRSCARRPCSSCAVSSSATFASISRRTSASISAALASLFRCSWSSRWAASWSARIRSRSLSARVTCSSAASRSRRTASFSAISLSSVSRALSFACLSCPSACARFCCARSSSARAMSRSTISCCCSCSAPTLLDVAICFRSSAISSSSWAARAFSSSTIARTFILFSCSFFSWPSMRAFSASRASIWSLRSTSFFFELVAIILQREANSRVDSVSSALKADGLTHATSTVLEFPLRHSFRSRVSLDSRNGGTEPFCLDVRAAMTFPRTVSDWLMAMPSFSRSPAAAVFFWRSLPAKSTKWMRD